MKNRSVSIKGAIIIAVCAFLVLALEWGTIFVTTALVTSKNIISDMNDSITNDFYDYSNNETDKNTQDYSDYKTYENTELGVKFKYPKEFSKTEETEEDGYKTILFYNPNTGTGVNIVVGDTIGIKDFDSYINASINSLKKSYNLSDEDIKIDKDNVYMGMQKAFKDYYSYSGVSIYQCATLKDITEYVLTYSAKEENFDESVGDKIFNSFEFINESEESSNLSNKKGNTKDSPADINEWCVASKYNPNIHEYQNVKVKVTNIVRGEEAANIVKDYANNNSNYNYKDPETDMEWVVIDYDVDMQNFDIPSHGTSPDVDVSIVGTGTYSSVKYNNKTYVILVDKVSSSEYVKTKNSSNKIATTLPIGCTNYLIKFGTYNETTSYVKGK